MSEKKEDFIYFPTKRITLDTYQCPCGMHVFHQYKDYYTGLDDADSDWGGYDESYGFSTDDPCYQKYRIIRLDDVKYGHGEAKYVFILQKKT